jgi:hypothetical protein
LHTQEAIRHPPAKRFREAERFTGLSRRADEVRCDLCSLGCHGALISAGALPHSTYAGTGSQGQSQSMRLREAWEVMECRASSTYLCVSFRRSLSQDRVFQRAESRSRPIASAGVKETQISQHSRPGQLHSVPGAPMRSAYACCTEKWTAAQCLIIHFRVLPKAE